MPNVPKWRRYLRFWRADVAGDVDDELRFHFEARGEELRARGLSPGQADQVIAEEFGDVEAARRAMREIGERVERRRERLRWWHQVGSDLRYAARGLRAAPLFAAGVVATLALGVGAMATMYGTTRRLLLRPPPHVLAPASVAKMYFHHEPFGDSAFTFDRASYPFYERLRDQARTLAAVAAYTEDADLPVGRGADAQKASATFVSEGFWRTLGTRPALGRFLADDEAHPATGGRVVVLGHAFWRRRYGGDPAAVGTTLQIKGQPYRVVGVAPRGFRGVELSDADVWLPLYAYGDGERGMRNWHNGSVNLALVARVRPGTSRPQAVADLSRLRAVYIDEENRKDMARGASPRRAAPARVTLGAVTGALGSDGRRIPEATVVVWLVGVAAALLLVACANVASLLLMRALRRRREIAVRLTLGMTRRRLTALLLVESALLAALGGLASASVAVWGGAAVRRVLIPDMVSEAPGVDWQVVVLSVACVMLVALLTGLAPALHTFHARRERGGRTPTPRVAALNDGAQHGATRRSRTHWGLLVAQTALSAVLLVGAGLFLRSLHRVTTMDFGVDTENVLVVSINFAGSGRPGRDVVAFYERALERVSAVPGVARASLAIDAPYRGFRGAGIKLPGATDWFNRGDRSQYINFVTPGYFSTTGLRVLAGRDFTAAERAGSGAVIVTEALARAAWPGRSPVGECIGVSSKETGCLPVVGVVATTRDPRGRDADRLVFYQPLDPTDVDSRVLLVRLAPGTRGARVSAGTLRRALHGLDAALPYVDVSTVGSALDYQIRPWRLGAALFTTFGALAALLAALGLYTAVAYAVAQRRRELGVRAALGATAPAIVRFVVADGLRVAVAGVAAGVTLALWGGRWVADLLFDTSPRDATVLGAVTAGLLAVAALASAIPARRAARVSPTEALRAE